MPGQLLLAFVVFAAVGAFTPGPNNAMLVTSALNFGLRRAVPHILGVSFGFAFLILVFGFGLGALFQSYPIIHTVLKYAGALYLVWLAIMIARSAPPDMEKPASGRPLTFMEAVLFQWVNVKGLVVGASAVTAYAGIAAYPTNVLLQGGIFFVITLAATFAWAAFGASLRYVLRSSRAVRVFNIVMAVALIASLYPVLVEP